MLVDPAFFVLEGLVLSNFHSGKSVGVRYLLEGKWADQDKCVHEQQKHE